MEMGRLFAAKKPEKEKILPVRRDSRGSGFLLIAVSVLIGTLSMIAIFAKLQGPPLPEFLKLHPGNGGGDESAAHVAPFDCSNAPQATPVLAHEVEGVAHPFIVSLADLGSPEKPNRNFERVSKGKKLQKFPVSLMVQRVLRRLRPDGPAGGPTSAEWVVDVGANVGMATYAAAAMGFRVLAFEPIFENMQRLCDGLYLNRASHLVQLYHAAVSDKNSNLTMHKVLGRLDNSAVSSTGATLAFPSNKVVPVAVPSATLDSLVPQHEPVVLLKIDVQGHEFHVLRGAADLFARPGLQAPFLVYEEDERLLRENNSSSRDILRFLEAAGYKYCRKEGENRHCWKDNLW